MKYKLTDETKEILGRTVYRIKDLLSMAAEQQEKPEQNATAA